MRGHLSHRYLIALGSNMRLPRVGGPRQTIEAALAALGAEGLVLEAASRIIDSAPLGPARRRYANAAAVISSELSPPAMLGRLQSIERAFGRRRRGGKWRARTLDLDIVLWSGGVWASDRLTIPHRECHHRAFVLGPAATIAADWRDPATGRTLRQLWVRLTRPRQLPSCQPRQATRWGP